MNLVNSTFYIETKITLERRLLDDGIVREIFKKKICKPLQSVYITKYTIPANEGKLLKNNKLR